MRTTCSNWALTIGLVAAAALSAVDASAADVERCQFRGVTEPAIDTDVFNDHGQVIARLTGSATPIEVAKLPEMPSAQARIVTSTPEVRGFRIGGFVSVRALGIRAKTPIEVIPSLVTLTAGVRLDGVVQVGNEIFVEKRIERDFSQTVVARANCNMLGFSDQSAMPEPLPAKARAFRFDNDKLPLFDRATATGEPSMTLTRHAAATPVLFFSVKAEGNWLRVRYDGELTILAWARKADLTALPIGELADRLSPPGHLRSVPKLDVGAGAQLLRATQTVPLRQKAALGAAVIGEVDAESEFYVVEVVSGWASVIPRSLGVVPAPNGQFWVEAKAIGL